MERIKFHIKQTGWASLWYWFLNEWLLTIFLIGGVILSIQTESLFILILILIPILPIIIVIWRWRTITITGNYMIIHYGIFYPYVRVKISSVQNVHYKEKGEDFLGKSGFNTPFQNYQDVVCFQTPKGRYHIAVKETKAFYELLKKREVYPEAE